MDGLPADKAKLVVKFLTEAAAKRDIPIVDQDFPDSWKLTGEFIPQQEPDGTVKVVYGWTLWDAKSRSIHQISGAESVGSGGGDPWVSVTPDLLRRVAEFTTESVSSRLSQLGYATQIAGLLPPTHAYVRAGPGAEKDIDYETLYGSQVAVAQDDYQHVNRGAMPMATRAIVPATDDVAREEPVVRPSESRQPQQKLVAAKPKPTTKNSSDKAAIRAVALTGVEGAPGSGNRELAAAMRKVLASAGWPVISQPRDDALTISGDVAVGPKSGSVQNVALAWSVSSPDGKLLGTIKQANDVPAGSLDGEWGKTADYAAEAGAEGIFKLVQKYR